VNEDNPIIKIETPFTTIAIPVSELTPQERNGLASLLGFSGARKEAFAELRGLPRFKKVRREDVWNSCPKGSKFFPVAVSVALINNTVKGRDSCDVILAIMPEAKVSAAVHTAAGYCAKCDKVHRVSKYSVLVKLTVEGVPFSTMYSV